MIWIMVVIAIFLLIVMERKEILDDGEFAIAIVMLLFAVAGYTGVSQY